MCVPYGTQYGTLYMNDRKQLPARFFVSQNGRTPVREWLLDLTQDERNLIGDNIRAAEFGWPVGMPLCRAIKNYKGSWEIRTNLSNKKIALVLFCSHGGEMILLHGFIKMTQKTPKSELDTAMKRMRGLA